MAETTPPLPTLSYDREVWLVYTLAQTEYRAGVREKYKRVWGEDIAEDVFQSFTEKHKLDIQSIRTASRREIDSHPNSDAYTRMNHFEDIRKKAMEGVCVGIDKQGDPVMKIDLKEAREALKESRNEKQILVQNELILLGMMIKAKQVNPLVGGDTSTDTPSSLQGETTTITDVTGTSDTMKHLNFNG